MVTGGVFGIDFDGTFSFDPPMFREIVAIMRKYGHTPIMVTQRCAKFAEEVETIVGIPDLPIIYASGKTKEDAARLAGYPNVQFWMDDSPYSVYTPLAYRGC